MEKIRLNKFLADSGVCSRRAADALISEGRVRIGKDIAEVGTKIDPEKDAIFVDGKKVGINDEKIYYVLNKPAGYVTTSSDPHDRKKVTDLVPKNPRVYPVGRLDCSTSGLLILTNDGDFTHKLTHPKFEKEKEYEVEIKSQISNLKDGRLISHKFLEGVRLEEGIAKADKISVLEERGNVVRLSIVIHQGWNRQIRRMCEKIGLEVIRLKRVRVEGLKLGDLKIGEYRIFNEKEIKKYF
jgi:pseudouridine synthase